MPENHAISFGIAVPQVFYPGSVDMALVRSFVTRAEALGFESLWVQERIIGGVDSLEPVNLLSYVAALTNTAKLGTSMLILSTRNPIMLAKELTTLDHLGNGRLIVGVGLGGLRGRISAVGSTFCGRSPTEGALPAGPDPGQMGPGGAEGI